jgi:anthraniloyl-CoA monooxygenase
MDRPLPHEGWPLVAASPLPYARRSQTPSALDEPGMRRMRAAFRVAAQMAATAGFDMLAVQLGHGYLLGSFLSPLTNRREDGYGGTLAARMRFPLEVVEEVRAAWPAERPVAVALNAADYAAGGTEVEEAVEVARALREVGCDLLIVQAGQTVPHAEPPVGRGFLTPLSDRVRNEAGIPTVVGGYLTTIGEANTALAAGRADLCRMELTELDDAVEPAPAAVPERKQPVARGRRSAG